MTTAQREVPRATGTPIERAIQRLPERYRALAGTLGLLFAAWICMYGRIWSFESKVAHRFTARALLTGTLRLRGMVTHAGHDEQIYNGAVYTNWGFGVPVLQAPFHALAGLIPPMHGFFPDRAIFFFYVAAMVPVLWAALDRLLTMVQPPGGSRGWRMATSWAATWLVLNVTLFPFMSTRFVVYEETLSYFVIFELLALSAYIFALRSWSAWAVAAMALAGGIALMVRSIGAVYLCVWGLLVLLERRKRVQRVLLFGAVVLPFVAFFCFSNWVRSGSLLGLGYGNSNPAWDFETPILRFGSVCEDSPTHVAQTVARLFYAFFVYVSPDTYFPWMKSCHFGLEERDKAGDPFLGPGILVLLVGMAVGLVRRREKDLRYWLPYAAVVMLFVTFVARGDGFAWRYVGDFWTLIVLATVQYVASVKPASLVPFDRKMTKILFWAGFAFLARFLVPWEWNARADTVDQDQTAKMDQEFRAARWETEGPLPTKLTCDHRPDPDVPYHNGLGWKPGCGVGQYTEVYLGVPAKSDDHYTVRFTTEGFSDATLQVYVNGRVVQAHRVGDAYEAETSIHYPALVSPTVMVTVLWVRQDTVPAGKLLSIEIV